jgi:CHAT domain-containing protein
MDEKIGPLPEAERQVKLIESLYGAGQSKILTGEEAREDRVKTEAGKCRILHLATHGVFNDKSPMYSHLLLAQPKGDDSQDGLLEAWEIMNMDLNADLVVLSACETARGRVGSGEGIIGLTWSSFIAGAPAVVVSQWKVEASSTTELMVGFHRNLKSGLTKAEALRRSSLALLKTAEFRHPFYWAGFILVGRGN